MIEDISWYACLRRKTIGIPEVLMVEISWPQSWLLWPRTACHRFAVGEVGSLVALGCGGGRWVVVLEISGAGFLVSTWIKSKRQCSKLANFILAAPRSCCQRGRPRVLYSPNNVDTLGVLTVSVKGRCLIDPCFLRGGSS